MPSFCDVFLQIGFWYSKYFRGEDEYNIFVVVCPLYVRITSHYLQQVDHIFHALIPQLIFIHLTLISSHLVMCLHSVIKNEILLNNESLFQTNNSNNNNNNSCIIYNKSDNITHIISALSLQLLLSYWTYKAAYIKIIKIVT